MFPSLSSRMNQAVAGLPRSLLPLGAWDTHVHVFDSSIGPFATSRAYTPGQALLSEWKGFSSGISQTGRPACMVLVQPSPYGTDNTVLLHTLKQLRDEGAATARGIAVVDVEAVEDEELWKMHELGVRGLRLNMQANGHGIDVEKLGLLVQKAAERVRGLPGWKLQLFCPARVWDDLYDTIRALPVQVIVDHIGGLLGSSKLHGGNPLNQPGFESLVALARESKVIVKISGLYRASSRDGNGFDDLGPVIKALAAEIPDRLVWASDWPHTGEGRDRRDCGLIEVEGFRVVDNEGILKHVWEWVGGEVWQKMMVDTPVSVYR